MIQMQTVLTESTNTPVNVRKSLMAMVTVVPRLFQLMNVELVVMTATTMRSVQMPSGDTLVLVKPDLMIWIPIILGPIASHSLNVVKRFKLLFMIMLCIVTSEKRFNFWALTSGVTTVMFTKRQTGLIYKVECQFQSHTLQSA